MSLQTAADRKTICVQAEDWIKNEENTNNRKTALKAQSTKNFERELLKWVNASDITSITARQTSFKYNIRFVDNIFVDNWKNVLENHGYTVTVNASLFEVSIPTSP